MFVSLAGNFRRAGEEEVASSAGRRQNTQRTESFYNVCTIYGLQGRRALLAGMRGLSERVNNLFWHRIHLHPAALTLENFELQRILHENRRTRTQPAPVDLRSKLCAIEGESR